MEKQGQLLKWLKEENGFMETMGLGRSHVYFKIWLHKFFSNYAVFKKSTLASNYLETNSKLIKNVCMDNLELFGKNDWWLYLMLFFYSSSIVRILLSKT